jgi:long-subunit fatty acid transport protein
MACSLFQYKKTTPTHWIGSNGMEYPINEYMNWGGGITKNGKKDLPEDGYPYRYKYETKPLYLCCQLCECQK